MVQAYVGRVAGRVALFLVRSQCGAPQGMLQSLGLITRVIYTHVQVIWRAVALRVLAHMAWHGNGRAHLLLCRLKAGQAATIDEAGGLGAVEVCQAGVEHVGVVVDRVEVRLLGSAGCAEWQPRGCEVQPRGCEVQPQHTTSCYTA